MRANLGKKDRLLRLLIALLLLLYALIAGSYLALLASLFTFFEAYMSWCILYQLLGKNSCPK